MKETLWFCARMKLPRFLPKLEIRKRVNFVIAQLQLMDVKHCMIGTAKQRGVSGGQKKRVSQ